METIKALTQTLSICVESAAALIIGLAVLQTTINSLLLFLPFKKNKSNAMETVRINLGHWLAVSLELELGADILRTAVAPTWNEIGQLGAIIVLRTALNYFLQLEIEKSNILTH